MPLFPDELQLRLPDVTILRDEPMYLHTTFKIGGSVTAMLLPDSVDALSRTLAVLYNMSVTPVIIGQGSNLLVDDGKLDIVVVKTTKITDLYVTDGNNIHVSCGVPLSRAAVFARDNALSGLEFAHGIPGSAGGGIFMNAGAYNGEMSQIIVSVDALSVDGSRLSLNNAQCGFSYRHSAFADNNLVIAAAELALTPASPDVITDKMNQLSRRRRESQPLELPSAGSAFKRPSTGYAAALIDEAGLKGFQVGGAKVSDKHAGFIVNTGGASFRDVLVLIDEIRDTVANRTGIVLEPEIRIIKGA